MARKQTTEPIPDYKAIQIVQHLQIARYLLSNADTKGMTHGEKHHLIECALMELGMCLELAEDETYSVLAHHNVPEATAIDDIPF